MTKIEFSLLNPRPLKIQRDALSLITTILFKYCGDTYGYC